MAFLTYLPWTLGLDFRPYLLCSVTGFATFLPSLSTSWVHVVTLSPFPCARAPRCFLTDHSHACSSCFHSSSPALLPVSLPPAPSIASSLISSPFHMILGAFESVSRVGSTRSLHIRIVTLTCLLDCKYICLYKIQ